MCEYIQSDKDYSFKVIIKLVKNSAQFKLNYYELFQRTDITDEFIKYCIKYGQEYYFVPINAWVTLTTNPNFPLKLLGKLIRMLEEDSYNIKNKLNWDALSKHPRLNRRYIKNHMFYPWKLESIKFFFNQHSSRYKKLMNANQYINKSLDYNSSGIDDIVNI